MPIFIPTTADCLNQQSGIGLNMPTLHAITWAAIIIFLTFQYISWFFLMYEREFDSKFEAIAWLVPGYPLLKFTIRLIQNFWDL